VHRRAVDVVARPISTILPEVHDRDPVGDMADDGEVVRDEEVGEPEVVLEAREQVDDLRLDRHVERRDGLVEDDQGRVEGERAGDADALPLAAGELVREAVAVLGAEADGPQQLGDALLALRAVDVVDPQGLGDDLAHRHARVQRRVRILEDDLDLTPHRAHRRRFRFVMSWPSKTIEPDVGSSSLMIVRPSVVLPQPDSPTTPSVSPLRTERSTRRRRERRRPCA
jgi:hypothetical protein